MFEIEVAVGHGSSQLRTILQHVLAVNLEATGPVVLRITHIVEVVGPDAIVQVVDGIVGTDATATGHVADRPVEELDLRAVGCDELELIHLRGEETLTPETAGIPEEVAGVVTTTVNVSLELDDPYTFGIA